MDGSPLIWSCAIALTIPKYFTGSHTGPARNRVKRCIVFRSAGPRQDGLQKILQGHKPDT
ncbi:hypothetical protein P692DRAFT_20838521 [Suillus brevipes Sb2]|nr:hypothetical protein P692DRAFT_20838521 [Suillus brevipes Sb2]